MSQNPALLCIEFNEFNPDFLKKSADTLGLTNLQCMLALNHATTTTDDTTEGQGLDPWAQWVSIHSGQPVSEHGIRRLGNTQGQTAPQIWHKVAANGYRWGAWGVINAPLGDSSSCDFFMPDPWSFDERALPENLNHLLALPRHVAKNYLDVNYAEAGVALLRLARYFAPPSQWGLLARFSAIFVKSIASRKSVNVHTLTTLLDYLSVLNFIKLRHTKQPELSIIFLNHIAHLQHHFWLPEPQIHPEMLLGLQLSDAMFGLLLDDRKADEALLVLNGFRQENVAGKGYHVYRQTNPVEAVTALGIAADRVEQNMTHEATLIFSDSATADAAFATLDGVTLSDGHKAFFVERQSESRVFYQLSVTHHVAPDVQLICGNNTSPFYDFFQLLCERTGAHIQQGDVYYDGLAVPETLYNHAVSDVILKHFSSSGTPRHDA